MSEPQLPNPFPDSHDPTASPSPKEPAVILPDPLLEGDSFIDPGRNESGAESPKNQENENAGNVEFGPGVVIAAEPISMYLPPEEGSVEQTPKSTARRSREEMSKRPSWLPDDWTIDLKVRSSGATAGLIDRISFANGNDERSHMDCGGTSVEEISQFEAFPDNENVEHVAEEDIEMETVDLEECNADVEGQNHEIPYVGQQFASVDDAYNAYNAYALFKGFGLRRGKTRYSEKTGELIRREIYCSKEGKKDMKERNAEGIIIESRRRETRTGCMARIIVSFNTTTGVWTIKTFNDDHNHELSTLSKSGKHRSHKQLHRLASTRRLIDTLHFDAGLAPSEIAKVVNVHSQVGGEMERVTPQQCHDQSRKQRRNNIGIECVSIINHFMELRIKDPLFFFAMELDEDKSLRSVFWADGRSITTYLQFSDVIVFDVTYKTNKFAMPFAPFTGVNHHRQSTLFGCALLADETEATFVWLFEQWLKCMGGKAPDVIITDMDKAIGNAIKNVFPMTRHRFCSWHIDKKIPIHFAYQLSHFDGFLNDYHEWYWSETIAESESRFVIFKEKYGLESNDWMMTMYESRYHWIPAYWRDVFTAGMRSSQQSESINAFFDGYVHAGTPLTEFVTQYEKALISRRTAEYDEDFKTMDSRPRLDGGLQMEFQAAQCYTRSMYDRFRQEFNVIYRYFSQQVGEYDDKYVFQVWNGTNTSAKRRLVVLCGVSDDNVTLSCSCAKFEMEGMLCRHIFSIMVNQRIVKIPEKYMLKRWSIAARHKGAGFDCASSDKAEVTPLQQFSLRVKQNRMFEMSCESEVIYIKYDTWLEEQFAKLDMHSQIESERGSNHMPLCRVPSTQVLSHSQDLEGMPEICVRDPTRVTTKGRPSKSTRIMSGIELATQKKAKKMISCRFCNKEGHNKKECPVRKGDKDKGESSRT